MKLTIQEKFFENIQSDSTTGITFIDGRSSIEHLSYKKLYLEACYKLHALKEKGLGPGDELVFQFESNKNFIITFWACILGKIVPVPLTYVSATDTVKKICGVWKKLKNPYVITDSLSLKYSFEGLKNDEYYFGEILEKFIQYDELTVSKRATPVRANHKDIAFIQFSSGSTGSPKGVVNTQEAILYNVNNNIEHLDINENDRFLGWVPLTHDMGLIFFHILPLLSNTPQFLMPPSLFLTYPELWMESLSEHNITISGSPNFGYKVVLENLDRIPLENLSFKSLRFMINSAEPVSVDVCRKFTTAFSSQGLIKNCIKPGYGLAEAVLGVSLRYHNKKNTIDEFVLNRSKLNVGSHIEISQTETDNTASFANLGEFDGTQITIVDENDLVLPDGVLGFIRLKSPAVTRSYYNDPKITEKVISEDGWLNTGDIGFIIDQDLVITGRAKEMILINGQNYFPNDIDRLLEEIPGISFQQVTSCSVFNERTHTDEIFVFVLYKGCIKEFIDLAAQIKKQISAKLGIMVSKVIAVDKINKSTSGKPQRYLLRDNFLNGKYDTFLEQLKEGMDLVKIELKKLTLHQVENKIIALIQDTTNIKEANVNTNFFDLGFNSIQAVEFKVALEEFFIEKIDEVILFKHPNVKELSEFIHRDVLMNDSKPGSVNRNNISSKARIGKLLKSTVLG